MGGNDQQGNIIAGIDLIRKKIGVTAYGITPAFTFVFKLKKFGKSEGGAVWLSPERTTSIVSISFGLTPTTGM